MINPDILADITLYDTARGGRKSPTPPDQFNCPIDIDGVKHDCRLLLNNIGPLIPGELKVNVPIKFLCPEIVMPKLGVGKKFYLWELRIIGEGLVRSITGG